MNRGGISSCIRLHHPTLPAERITELLEEQPEIAHSAGRPRMNPAGRPLPGTYPATYLVIATVLASDADVRVALETCLAWLEERAGRLAEFWETGGTTDLYVTAEPTDRMAMVLPVELLARCVNLRAELQLEVLMPNRFESGEEETDE